MAFFVPILIAGAAAVGGFLADKGLEAAWDGAFGDDEEKNDEQTQNNSENADGQDQGQNQQEGQDNGLPNVLGGNFIQAIIGILGSLVSGLGNLFDGSDNTEAQQANATPALHSGQQDSPYGVSSAVGAVHAPAGDGQNTVQTSGALQSGWQGSASDLTTEDMALTA
ncbi:hypothetical protein [Marinactinospora rubrisoli]|uniref:Uncharacterized protein n=1 Tax=Marinactinospora rubrisoli TaxID=2715399 RepID=A0ABW2KPJ9_9ACTN